MTLLVNWRRVATLPAGGAGAWTSTSTVGVPPRLLNRDGINYVAFVARSSNGVWPTWGVRSIRLVRPGASHAAAS